MLVFVYILAFLPPLIFVLLISSTLVFPLPYHMVEMKNATSLINAHLPPQIRVVAAKRVTRSFDCRHACGARMYEYLMPTYALAPYHLTTKDFRVPGWFICA